MGKKSVQSKSITSKMNNRKDNNEYTEHGEDSYSNLQEPHEIKQQMCQNNDNCTVNDENESQNQRSDSHLDGKNGRYGTNGRYLNDDDEQDKLDVEDVEGSNIFLKNQSTKVNKPSLEVGNLDINNSNAYKQFQEAVGGDGLSAYDSMLPEDRPRDALWKYKTDLSVQQLKIARDLEVNQDDIDRTEEEYEAELQKLRMKFYRKKVPLLKHRAELLNNRISNEKLIGTSSIPNFWLEALRNNSTLDSTIFNNDMAVLSYLKDIEFQWLEETGIADGSFKINFVFETNPYFEPLILEKKFITYIDDEHNRVLERTESSKIMWKENKNITETVIVRKQRNRRTKETRVITESKKEDSFFHFFTDINIPDDIEKNEKHELEDIMDFQYECAICLRDSIIPNAVNWYLGKIVEVDQEESSDATNTEEDGEEENELTESSMASWFF